MNERLCDRSVVEPVIWEASLRALQRGSRPDESPEHHHRPTLQTQTIDGYLT